MKTVFSNRINDNRRHTRLPASLVIIVVALSLLTLVGCASQPDPAISWREPITSWHDHTILPNSDSMVALNARANNSTNSQSDRALAVFTLFARHILPGSSAADVRRAITNTAWISDTKLYGIRALAGWLPVDMTFEDTVFCLQLFPLDTDKQSNPWAIYFRLSGQVKDEDALEFLKGEVVAGNPKLIEFALCFPYSTKPRRSLSRMERFSRKGVHVYDELQ